MYKNRHGIGTAGRLYRKIGLIMRLTTIILLACLMQVSAATLAQKVTLNERNASLNTVLKEIRKQSGYDVFFDGKALQKNQKVTVVVKDASVEQALDEAFKGLDLTYQIEGNIIAVKPKAPTTFIDKVIDRFQEIDAHGTVVDEQNKPIPGATVKLKNGKTATITDQKGQFTLKQVNAGEIISISFIGYDTKDIPAAADLGVIQISVATSKLDEVVVQAYGKTSQRLSTGNIGTVTAKEIEKQPVTNPLLALQGKVPGLVVEQATGFSNSGVKVRIQGQNSLTNGSDPLYVIDGVPYFQQLMPGPDGAIVLGSSGATFNSVQVNGNPLSFINPADIESVTVLKDAEATSIYGSRGASGVLLITTKKGKAGTTSVSANLQAGVGQVAERMALLNSSQYMMMRKEAYYTNDQLTSSSPRFATQYDLNGTWDTNRYTDWQKVLLGGNALYHDGQFSISGGEANTQFLVSGNYHKETTVFPGDFDDQKGGMRFTLNNRSADSRFKLQFSGSYQIDNNNLPGIDLTQTAMRLAPVAPALYNADGSLNWAQNAAGVSTWTNPLALTLNKTNIKTNNLTSSLDLRYELAKGLSAGATLGYNDLRQKGLSIYPYTAVAPENRVYYQPLSERTSSVMNSWSIEPQINYHIIISEGKLDALLGASIQQSNSESQRIYGFGFTDDLQLPNLGAATSYYADNLVAVYKYSALFGRLNYVWKDKYIVNLSARRDGSSRFGSENQFHNFWSASGGWVFTEEPFAKAIQSILPFGKLRGSYGTSGSDQIGDYRFLNLYGYTPVEVAYQQVAGLTVSGLPNPYLQWEETQKLQAGIDLGFLEQQRLLVTVNYFRNRSSNQLLGYTLPFTTGFSQITRNFPATLQNSGLEFQVNYQAIKTKAFQWTTAANLTIPHNKLVAFPNLASSSYASDYIIGQPYDIGKLYKYAGVNSTTGLYQYLGANGNLTSSPDYTTDRSVLVSSLPRFYGGLSNAFNYKGFQLDLVLQFVKQQSMDPFAITGFRPGLYSGSALQGNQPVSVLNRWTAAGDVAAHQKYSALYSDPSLRTAYNNTGNSDLVIQDASYLRLKNVALSYELPRKYCDRVHAKSIRLFLQGQNLFTITKFKGLDPETRSSASLPPLRVITAGLKTTF